MLVLGLGQMTPAEARLLPPLTLAYLGDAVFELYVRSRLLHEASRHPAGALHRQAVRHVKATAQADALRQCLGTLTDEEADIARRGRNVRPSGHRSADTADSHYSTAFEALIGYLHLSGQQERLMELMKLAYESVTDNKVQRS